MRGLRQSTGLAISAAVVCALALAACARQHEHSWDSERTGSLKDETTSSPAYEPERRAYRAAARSDDNETPSSSPAMAPSAPRVASTAPEVRPRVIAPLPVAPARPSTVAPATAPPPAAAATPPPLPPADDPASVARLLAEGQALFEQGRVIEARRRYIAAMNGPVPEVLLSLARSYDTYYLSRLPKSDAAPDMQRALVLYERALERGAKEAAADLDRTRAVLRVPR